jgi:hypothetical protein
MIVAQGLNKIYLTIAQSIARFGRFFCVELLRFNTCDGHQFHRYSKAEIYLPQLLPIYQMAFRLMNSDPVLT